MANGQTADFTYQSSSGLYCTPSTIQFIQTSSGTPLGYVWTFGDGNSSSLLSPVNTYTIAGTYTVKLQVIYEQTTVTVTKTILINPSITASLAYDRNYICTPGVINFTAGSSGNIASYQWYFGDGSPVSTTMGNATPHNYSSFGNYYPVVKAIDASGCFATATVHIVVEKPQITGIVSPRSGCIPAFISFSANVLLPVGGSVTSYTWDFADGSPVSTTVVNNSNHSYANVGTYLPTLNIVTNEGCTNSFNFPSIAFGIPPTNHVAYPKKTVICGSETAQFVSKATNANSYYWDFGDGTNTTVTDTLATHKYTTLGTKTITATPLFNGCAGTPISFTIDVVGVIAGYTYSNTCSNPKQYSFVNTSQGNLSTITWDFGDGSSPVNTTNAVHTFPAVGSFATSLTVTDNITGCSDVFTKTIYTANPSMINPDTSICRNSNTTFTITNNYNNPSALYTWHVAGMVIGPADSAHITISANIHGNFNNNYVIIDNGPESCPDTVLLTRPLLVRGPDLSFTSPDSICLKSPYIVTNTSQPFVPGDNIVLWYWNFGVTTVNDTAFQPQPYTGHPYPGTWDIQLNAVDMNGCKDSLHKILRVDPTPFVHSVPGLDTLCQGRPDTLIVFHSGSILWSPAGSVSCATCDTVIVNPASSTNFYVTATNNFNCSSKDSVYVKVYTPFTATANPANLFTCLNDPVQLNMAPRGYIIAWSPAAGLSNANIYTPVATPTGNIAYTATLADSVGCFASTATVNVYVSSKPFVDAGPDKIYPYNTTYSFTPSYSNNVSSYEWSPSALLSCSNCPYPSGISAHTETYTLTVTSDSGCVANDVVTIFVECKDANLLLPGAFTPNNDATNDYFYPITRGIKKIIRFSIFNREGQLVFEAKDFLPNDRLFGWDGRYKGKSQPATAYVYYIEATCEAGATLHKKGTVLLMR